MIDALQKAVDAACAKLDEQRAELAALRAKLALAEKALDEARLQIIYMHEKFETTGSGNATLAQIANTLAAIREGRE